MNDIVHIMRAYVLKDTALGGLTLRAQCGPDIGMKSDDVICSTVRISSFDF
jgi:hypothetical protein